MLTLDTIRLKMDSVLAEGVKLGEVGRFGHRALRTWQLSWLTIERPWLALDRPFFCIKNMHRKHSSSLVEAPFFAL